MSSQQDYPQIHRDFLTRLGNLGKDIPETVQGFQALHGAATRAGALSTKVKELVALGIAIAIRCDGCIASHVHDAIQHGATREEIAEAVGVAILMGGGPSTVYGSLAMLAYDQFQAQG